MNTSLGSRAAITVTFAFTKEMVVFLTTIAAILFLLYLQQIDEKLKSLRLIYIKIFSSLKALWSAGKHTNLAGRTSQKASLFYFFYVRVVRFHTICFHEWNNGWRGWMFWIAASWGLSEWVSAAQDKPLRPFLGQPVWASRMWLSGIHFQSGHLCTDWKWHSCKSAGKTNWVWKSSGDWGRGKGRRAARWTSTAAQVQRPQQQTTHILCLSVYGNWAFFFFFFQDCLTFLAVIFPPTSSKPMTFVQSLSLSFCHPLSVFLPLPSTASFPAMVLPWQKKITI